MLLAQHFWVLQTQPRAPRVALAAHHLPLSPAPHLSNEDTPPASRSSSHACLGKASLGPAALAQVQLVLGSGSPGLAGRDQRSRRLRTQVGRSRGQGEQGSQDSQLQTPQMLTGLNGPPLPESCQTEAVKESHAGLGCPNPELHLQVRPCPLLLTITLCTPVLSLPPSPLSTEMSPGVRGQSLL